MAVTHSTDRRNAIADLITGGLDGGTLEYLTAGAVFIAAGSLSTPAAPAAVGGEATFNAIGNAINSTGGTLVAGQFTLTDSTSNDDVFGSVTTTGGGGDIEITDTSIADGVPITTNSLTYAAPA